MRPRPEYKLKRSSIPLLIGAASAVIAFLLLHAPALLLRSLLSLFIGVSATAVSGMLFPTRMVKLRTRYIAPTSGVAELDKSLRDAQGLLDGISASAARIRPLSQTLAGHTESCIATSHKIMEYAATRPELSKTLHRFFGYYLPLLDKLTGNYLLLSEHSANGRSPSETKLEIEDAVAKLDTEFNSLLDRLFDDAILDISTDIDVLENMIGGGRNGDSD